MATACRYFDGTQQNQHWYRLAVGAPVHDPIVAYAKVLLANESSFHSKNNARERIYEGIELQSQRLALASLERGGMGIARLNALKSIIDTFVSRQTKDKPMPAFITDDGDWMLKQQAKKFRKFIVGQMLETEFDDLSRDAAQDGAILGSAFTRIDDADDSVYAERTPVNDVLFDRRECKYGKPLQAIVMKRIARDVLAEMFPSDRDEIMRAPAAERRKEDDTQDGPTVGDLDDYVDLFEAWRLPSTCESEDGRHAMVFAGGTLLHERWHEPRFPWAMYRMVKPRWGIYGLGMVDGLAELQHRVNRIVRDIQLNLAATGRGHFLVNDQNDIPVEMLSGFQPFKLKYKGGQPPQWNTPTPFNAAQMSALDKFIGYMYELSGVSQAAATSRSALGAGASGVALDTQYDIDSDRFRMPQANYARYRLDGAQRYLDAAARVHRRREESKGKKRSWVGVAWKNRDAIERLDYAKVALKNEQYRLQIEPVNFLPDTRAGKLSVVEQLAKAGVIPQWLVPSLFDEPDLQQANAIMLAAFQNAMRKMDDLADPEVPLPAPEPYNDLELENKLVVAYYNRVQMDRAPDEVQDRYRQYADLVKQAIEQKKRAEQAIAASAPSMGAGAPSPGAPPGAPGPMAPAEQPLPGGIPVMPTGPVPPPIPIGAQAPPLVM